MSKLTIDQILEKAFTTGDLTNGGLLGPDQAAQFVRGMFEKSVVSQEVRRVPMKANKMQIDKITYSASVLQKPVAVGTEHTTTTKPTTSKLDLSAAEVIVAIDIGYDSLEDSIEGQGLFDTILELTEAKLGPEMDNLILYGDTSLAGGTVLDQVDGVFKRITSYSYDAASATLSDTILFNTLKILPGMYLDSESDWRFWVSHKARLDYVKALADKNVNDAFTRYLLEAKEPTYQGIPVRKVGAMATEDLDAGTPVVPGSKGLLINPKNVILGIHRDIMYEMERVPRKRIVEVTMTMRLDVQVEEEAAAVKILNIKHSV